MIHRRPAVAMARAVLLSLLLAEGCHKDVSKPKIVFIVPTLANPFFADMATAAREAGGQSPDIALEIQAPPAFTDLTQQISLIEGAITRKAGVICLDAADSKAVVPALKKAQDAHIPVLLVDDTVDADVAKSAGVQVAGYVGSDNFLGGRLAAEYIGKTLGGRGDVAMLEGVLGSDVATARKQGFLAGIAKFPDIRLIGSQTANYDREQGLNVFQTMLLAHPQISALFAANDEMALGAIEAIRTGGKTGKILVVGFDATPDGIHAVQAGTMAATIQQQPKVMAQVAIRLASSLLQGQSVPAETLVPVQLTSGGGH